MLIFCYSFVDDGRLLAKINSPRTWYLHVKAWTAPPMPKPMRHLKIKKHIKLDEMADNMPK